MKIVAEKSIPYLQGLLEPFAEVSYLDNPEITQERVRDADALIVRSITKCRANLLEGTAVRYVVTATAGIDHIDTAYCQRQGIVWQSAAGCNAVAVAQYVFAALALMSLQRGYDLKGKTLGIIGVGHVGRQVERLGRAWGMRILRNDPPRAEAEGAEGFVDLACIQRESDIITLHVPLTEETHHLVDASFLAKCTRQPILINACRGAVCDSAALQEARSSGQISCLIVDCWEGEPCIPSDLLEVVDLATPHIAGFSADGKYRGSRMAALSLAKHFGLPLDESILEPSELPRPHSNIDLSLCPEDEVLAQAMLATLDLRSVDARLRLGQIPFEQQRKHYLYPREMSAHTIFGAKSSLEAALSDIGFKIKR